MTSTIEIDKDIQDLLSHASDQVDRSSEDSMSYEEIYSSLILNKEIVITIPLGEEERTKTGIKNAKARQASKLKEDGMPLETTSLTFREVPSTEYEDAVDMTITLSRKASVPILKVRIPKSLFGE